MSMIPLAANFLAGSLISLLIPTGLLIALVVWYMLSVKRVPEGTKERPEAGPPATAPQPDPPPSGP